MMMNSGEKTTDFAISKMKISDMRPKEEFHRGDMVQVVGTQISRTIETIDADRRLAFLISGHKDGWWYLKDLKKILDFSRKDAESAKKFMKKESLIILTDPMNSIFQRIEEKERQHIPFSVIKFIEKKLEGVNETR